MTADSRLLSILVSLVSGVAALAALPIPSDLSDKDFGKYYDLNSVGANRAFCYQLRQLPPDGKALWIARVQRYRAQHGKGADSMVNLIMLAIGESELLSRYASDFSGSDGGPPWEVLMTADPALAALVGDDLLKANKDPNPGGDVMLFGRASRTWELIRMILRVAPEFSDPVKKWARAVPGGLWGEGEDLAIIREWWLANRDSMRAGRYTEVQPGVTLPGWLDGLPELDPPFEPGKATRPIMFGNNDPILIKMQYADYLEAKRTGKPYPPPLQANPPLEADATVSTARRWIVIAIAAVITAVIITGLWLWRRSRRLRPG